MEFSLVQRQIIDFLTWSPNPLNVGIVKYRLYTSSGGAETLLVELDVGLRQYMRLGVPEGTVTYALAAVNDRGVEGERAVAVVM